MKNLEVIFFNAVKTYANSPDKNISPVIRLIIELSIFLKATDINIKPVTKV